MADRISKDESARQMAAADKRIKGISSIANSAIKRSRVVELQKEYGTSIGNKQAVTSIDRALNSLSKTTAALAQGIKLITVETARGVKDITIGGAKAMNEYAKAIGEDININRQNFMVTTIGKFTPLVGYAVAKMMDTAVFRTMIEKMKYGLGRALDAVTSRFKKLASAGWEKGKEFWNNIRDKFSSGRGAVKTKVSSAKSKIKSKVSKKDVESLVPHMATGGIVKKAGLAKIHPAEVVQPIDKLIETIVKSIVKALEKKEKPKKKESEEVLGGAPEHFYKKAKKKDLFGFAKITGKMTTALDIITRKKIGLETSIMKREKHNQKGLIKSFMDAYSEEAKQEELPLMERQVKATLEVKKTISGENKMFAATMARVLYEHPLFHGALILFQGLKKSITMPFKFLFKRRGVSTYAGDLSKRGTVFEQMANTLGQLYSGLMGKLDGVLANTYSTAEASIAVAKGNQGKPYKDSGLNVPAPGQKKGWSIAGSMAKLAYAAAVKGPAAAIQWALKKYAPRKVSKIASAAIKPGAIFRAAKTTAIDYAKEKFGPSKEKKEANEKYAALVRAENRKKKKEWIEGIKRKRAANEKYEKLLEKERLKELRENKKKETIIYKKKLEREEQRRKQNDAVERLSSFKTSQRVEKVKGAVSSVGEKYKSAKESVTGKFKSGVQTTKGILQSIASHTKETVKATYDNSAKSGGWFKKVVDGGKGLLNLLISLGLFLFKLPGQFASSLSGLLTPILAALGLGGVGKILSKVGGKALGAVTKVGGKALAKLGLGGAAAAAGTGAAEIAEKGAGAVAKGAAEATEIAGKGVGSAAKVATEGVEVAGKGVGTAAKMATEGAEIAGKGTASIAKGGVEAAAKLGGKGVLKSVVKKIPAIGFLAGLGFGLSRLMDGDYVGAAMEVASGTVSLVPGIGTAASIAIDAGLITRDVMTDGKTSETGDIEKKAAEAVKDVKKAEISSVTTAANNSTKTNEKSARENISPDMAKKLDGMQSSIAEFAPLAASFTGGGASAVLLAQYAQKYLNDNPNDLVKAADKIVGFGRENWIKAGLDPNMYDAANAISSSKQAFLSMWESAKKTGGGLLNDVTSGASSLANAAVNSGIGQSAANKANELYKSGVSGVNDLDKKYDISGKVDTAKNTVGTAAKSLPEMIESAMGKASTIFSEMSTFFKDAYGDPKKFYEDTKNKLWGGVERIGFAITALYEKLTGEKLSTTVSNVTAKAGAVYNSVANKAENISDNVTTKANNVAVKEETVSNKSSSYSSPREHVPNRDPAMESEYQQMMKEVNKMKARGNYTEKPEAPTLTGQKIATNGAKQDIGKAEMSNDLLEKGLKGVKDTITTAGQQTANMMHTVFNSSQSIVANKSNSGSGSGNSGNSARPIDKFTQDILLGNV